MFYPALLSFIRPIHGLDVAYSLFFFYTAVFSMVAYKRLGLFKNFLLFFWFINVFYAIFQNILLNSGFDTSTVMLHQNSHSTAYVIPIHSYIPGLYRVTGLFVESAPFVIFLSIFHIFLGLFGFRQWLKVANFFIIAFSGAKVGYVFFVFVFLNWINKRLRLNLSIFYPILFAISSFLFFIPLFKDFILLINPFIGGLGSFWVRLDGLGNVINYFFFDFYKSIFGYGYVSSVQLIQGDYEGPKRGIDFFSTFVFSNGLGGSLVYFILFGSWCKKCFKVNDNYLKNELIFVGFLMLLVMGSLQQFQYALFFVLISVSGAAKYFQNVKS